MTRHLERVDWAPPAGRSATGWPFTIPAVAQVVREGGLEVPDGVTFLVGSMLSRRPSRVEYDGRSRTRTKPAYAAWRSNWVRYSSA